MYCTFTYLFIYLFAFAKHFDIKSFTVRLISFLIFQRTINFFTRVYKLSRTQTLNNKYQTGHLFSTLALVSDKIKVENIEIR